MMDSQNKRITLDYAKNRLKMAVLPSLVALTLTIFLLLPAGAAGPDDTRSAAIPDPLLPFDVGAWLPTSWDVKDARTSFEANIDRLHTISPFWYTITNAGELKPLKGAQDARLVKKAADNGVRVIPTITNHFDRELTHAILSNESLAAKHRQDIVDEVMAYGYDGIDIDYENIAWEDKDLFSAWIAALAGDLHARDRLLTVTVQPKTFDAIGYNGPGALDYRALAASADEMRIMAYGWCWAGGCMGGSAAPGPISPLHWEQRIIRYAKSQAPADKIVMGLHLYGYDWPVQQKETVEAETTPPDSDGCWGTDCSSGLPADLAAARKQMLQRIQLGRRLTAGGLSGLLAEAIRLKMQQPQDLGVLAQARPRGRAIVWQQADALMKQHGASLQWLEDDPRGPVGEPWFSYADGAHAVVFANAESVMMRVNLARDEGLRGVIFWRLGGEDPALWEQLPRRYDLLYVPRR
jgi:spore germination protein YaaH